MATRNDWDLQEKMNLIRKKKRALSYCGLEDKFAISIGTVSNNPYLARLKSKLIDVYLFSYISKQKSTLDFFQTWYIRKWAFSFKFFFSKFFKYWKLKF